MARAPVTAFFLLLIALGGLTAAGAVLWRRLAGVGLLGPAGARTWVLAQSGLGAALVLAGIAGLLTVR